MFNDRFGLTDAVIEKRKTITRRIMYRLEDLNLGDKVTIDGGETGTVVCIMTDDYKDEPDVFGNIVIRACVCPHGMNPYLSIEIDSIVKVEKGS